LLQRLFHDFAPQRIYEYAFVGPAECLEARLKGMKCDIKFKYRIAESYQIAPTACFAAVF